MDTNVETVEVDNTQLELDKPDQVLLSYASSPNFFKEKAASVTTLIRALQSNMDELINYCSNLKGEYGIELTKKLNLLRLSLEDGENAFGSNFESSMAMLDDVIKMTGAYDRYYSRVEVEPVPMEIKNDDGELIKVYGRPGLIMVSDDGSKQVLQEDPRTILNAGIKNRLNMIANNGSNIGLLLKGKGKEVSFINGLSDKEEQYVGSFRAVTSVSVDDISAIGNAEEDIPIAYGRVTDYAYADNEGKNK